jgi:hypothetical protein
LDRPHWRWQIWIFHGVFGFGGSSLLCLSNRSISWMSHLFVPSKRWQRRKAYSANHLPILWEASHTVHKKYEGPNFYLRRPLYTQIKLTTILNEQGKNSPSRFEGQLTTHVTKCTRMV